MLGPRFDELGPDVRDEFLQEFTTSPSVTIRSSGASFGEHGRCLRRRGLLKRIGVITHPRADDGLSPALFDGKAW